MLLGLLIILGCTSGTLGGGGASKDLTSSGKGCLTTDPTSLDFGEVAPGTPASLMVDLANGCDGEVSVTSLEIADAGAPFSAQFTGSPIVSGGATAEVAVLFDTSRGGSFSSSLLVHTDADEFPNEVDLDGAVDAARLDVPDDVDLGSPFIGCSQTTSVTLKNPGLETLEIDDVSVQTSDEITLSGLSLPLSIEPGGKATVDVDYRPTDTTADVAALHLESSDPGRPSVDVGLSGVGTRYQRQTDSFEALAGRAVDVLVVVDTSYPIYTAQSKLQAAARSLVADLSSRTSDWKIGVITSQTSDFRGVGIIRPTDSSPADELAAAVTGTYTGAPENKALGMVIDAFTEGDAVPGQGFYERGDLIAVVLFQPTEDDSTIDPLDVVTELGTVSGDEDLLVVSAVAGDVPTPSCSGGVEAGERYQELTTATSGSFSSFCDKSWTSSMADVAQASTGQRTTFPLTKPAVPETIEVRVGGSLATGWTYDAESGAIVFDKAPTDVIDVAYDVEASCP